MAVVEIWSVLEWNGCDIFGDRKASLQYTVLYGDDYHGWRKTVVLDGPASGLNTIPGINRVSVSNGHVMFTGSPRTRVEAVNAAPARASRWTGMRRRRST